MGFQISDLLAGQSRDVGFNAVPGQPNNFVQTSYFTQNSQGNWQGANRAQVIKGSELQVFQPDDVVWTNGTQIYPFLFISDSDWTIDVCLEVPAGYQIVSPGVCGQTLVANQAKVFEFTVKDIGSPKEFKAHAKFTFTHNSKKQKFESDVPSHNKGKAKRAAAAQTLWGMVAQKYDNGPTNVANRVIEIAKANGIAIPEWDIAGKIDSRTLSASAIEALLR